MESQVTELAPGIVRLRAANPSPMTGSGTNTYVLQGATGCVVIDPGPALPAHLAAMQRLWRLFCSAMRIWTIRACVRRCVRPQERPCWPLAPRTVAAAP